MSIVVLGSVFVDIKGYPSGNYIPGGRNAGRVEYMHGGVGRNIAENLANMGLSPVFLSLLDESGVAGDVLRRLQRQGVRTEYLRAVPGGMGTWLAVFDNNNDVCASISRRPDMLPLLDTLEESGLEIFSQADSVLLELDLEEPVVRNVLQLSEKYGRRVYAAVSNISIALERREELQKVSCLVCNRSEAEILFSASLTSKDPDALIREISGHVQAARIPAVVVTLGSAGAVWADREGNSGLSPAWQVPVADTTGAGDAFFSGVAAGLTYGKSLQEACDIGTRLAASVVCTLENTCPRFLPEEFGLKLPD